MSERTSYYLYIVRLCLILSCFWKSASWLIWTEARVGLNGRSTLFESIISQFQWHPLWLYHIGQSHCGRPGDPCIAIIPEWQNARIEVWPCFTSAPVQFHHQHEPVWWTADTWGSGFWVALMAHHTWALSDRWSPALYSTEVYLPCISTIPNTGALSIDMYVLFQGYKLSKSTLFSNINSHPSCNNSHLHYTGHCYTSGKIISLKWRGM